MTVEEGETPLAPFMFEPAERSYVAAISAGGRMLLFPLAELKYMSRGRGMIVMGLEKNEKLLAVAVSDQTKLVVSGVARGREKEVALADAKLVALRRTSRAHGSRAAGQVEADRAAHYAQAAAAGIGKLTRFFAV